MQRTAIGLIAILLVLARSATAAKPGGFDGEYVDKKFLNGQAVFEFSVQQTGSTLNIAFDAAYSNGSGPAPEATGTGKVSGNHAQFTWKDSHNNSGTGTIALAGDDVAVSLKATKMSDSRCAPFYRDNMKLKRIVKK
jgi:hypothetical protein